MCALRLVWKNLYDLLQDALHAGLFVYSVSVVSSRSHNFEHGNMRARDVLSTEKQTYLPGDFTVSNDHSVTR